MWRRVAKQIDVELEELRQLVDTHRPLLERCGHSAPDAIELSALAAMLHSYYTGIENIFKRVAVEIDGDLPTGQAWHRALLDAMAAPGRSRPSVISMPTRERLLGYVHFRHLFRHAYSFRLRWEKMAALVLDCEETLRTVEAELKTFLQTGAQG